MSSPFGGAFSGSSSGSGGGHPGGSSGSSGPSDHSSYGPMRSKVSQRLRSMATMAAAGGDAAQAIRYDRAAAKRSGADEGTKRQRSRSYERDSSSASLPTAPMPSVGFHFSLPPMTPDGTASTSSAPSIAPPPFSPDKVTGTTLGTDVLSMREMVRPALKFAHPELQKRPQPGTGLKYHDFSTKSFPSLDDYNRYASETGLSVDSGVSRQWQATDTARPVALSRRGSVSSFTMNQDGSVNSFRFHSLPTTEALRSGAGSSDEFHQAYEASSQRVQTKTKNSVGNDETVNAVLADHAKIGFGPSGFEATRMTHGVGFSGKGIDRDHTGEAAPLYEPGVKQAKRDHKKGTPTQTFHSEPMMHTADKLVREEQQWPTLGEDRGMVSMVTSFPNQVCFNCGRMFNHETPQDSVTSGMSGIEFGGQHPGPMPTKARNSSAVKSTPFATLNPEASNKREVKAIHDWK